MLNNYAIEAQLMASNDKRTRRSKLKPKDPICDPLFKDMDDVAFQDLVINYLKSNPPLGYTFNPTLGVASGVGPDGGSDGVIHYTSVHKRGFTNISRELRVLVQIKHYKTKNVGWSHISQPSPMGTAHSVGAECFLLVVSSNVTTQLRKKLDDQTKEARWRFMSTVWTGAEFAGMLLENNAPKHITSDSL